MKEKVVGEGMFFVDDTKKEVTVDKGGDIQMSLHAEDVEPNEVAAQKGVSVKGFKLDKEVEQEKMSVKP